MTLLEDVDKIIHGARQEAYGNWKENFADIAYIWNMQIRSALVRE